MDSGLLASIHTEDGDRVGGGRFPALNRGGCCRSLANLLQWPSPLTVHERAGLGGVVDRRRMSAGAHVPATGRGRPLGRLAAPGMLPAGARIWSGPADRRDHLRRRARRPGGDGTGICLTDSADNEREREAHSERHGPPATHRRGATHARSRDVRARRPGSGHERRAWRLWSRHDRRDRRRPFRQANPPSWPASRGLRCGRIGPAVPR